MTIDKLVQRDSSWLSTGLGEGPVISSRVRLARNLEAYSFPGWASDDERGEIWKLVSDVFLSTKKPFIQVAMQDATELDKMILFERHYISQELAVKGDGCGVLVSPDESISVMVNEEDHVRIQSMQPGLSLAAAWRLADELDNTLEEQLTYAFSPKLGYLTSCPSNVGTGLRASVMLHLPGLVFMEEMEPVINGISKIGLAVRGMWGEGSEAAGNMFQISNQITLGRGEEEIIAHLEQIVLELIDHETNARQRLMQERAAEIEDHVARAKGILACAKLMTSAEAMNLLSTLRLGTDLGLKTGIKPRAIDSLFITIQPAHLQKLHKTDMHSADRDVVRAAMLRSFIESTLLDE